MSLLALAKRDLQSSYDRLSLHVTSEQREHLHEHLENFRRRAVDVIDAITCVFDSVSKGCQKISVSGYQHRKLDGAYVDSLEIRTGVYAVDWSGTIELRRNSGDDKVEEIRFNRSGVTTGGFVIRPTITGDEHDDLTCDIDYAYKMWGDSIFNKQPTLLEIRPFIDRLVSLEQKLKFCEGITHDLIDERSRHADKQLENSLHYINESPDVH